VKRNLTPGGALLHPLFLGALGVLSFNDHVLKHVQPGVISGKLSDFAGVLLLPLFLHGLAELVFARAGRPLTPTSADRWLLGCIALSLLVFGLPEVWHRAETAYRYSVGALQWPLRALLARLRSASLPALRPVRATADVTDLLATPMVLVAYSLGRRSPARARCRTATAVVVAVFVVGSLGGAKDAAARSKEPYAHDGFYMTMEGGAGLMGLDSNGSISNGFQQKIASSARAAAAVFAFTLGGTLKDAHLVLAGRLATSVGVQPVLKTLGNRFQLRDTDLALVELQGVVQYFPDLHRGLHFGASFGLGGVGVPESSEGLNPGFSGSLEVGEAYFFGRQWSIGPTLRLTAGRSYGSDGVDTATSVFVPSLLLTLMLH
jgi:hypothetical protein